MHGSYYVCASLVVFFSSGLLYNQTSEKNLKGGEKYLLPHRFTPLATKQTFTDWVDVGVGFSGSFDVDLKAITTVK